MWTKDEEGKKQISTDKGCDKKLDVNEEID